MSHKLNFTKGLMMLLCITFLVSCTKDDNEDFIEATQEIDELSTFTYHYGDISFSAKDGVYTAAQDKLFYITDMVVEGNDVYLFDTQEEANKLRPVKAGGNGSITLFRDTNAGTRTCRLSAFSDNSNTRNFPAGFNNLSNGFSSLGNTGEFYDFFNGLGGRDRRVLRRAISSVAFRGRQFLPMTASSIRRNFGRFSIGL